MAGALPYVAAFLGVTITVAGLSFLTARQRSFRTKASVFALSLAISLPLLGFAAHSFSSGTTRSQRPPDMRSEAQKQFDNVFDAHVDDSPETGNLIETLRLHAARLDPSDARQIDLSVLIALSAPHPERRTQLEAVLTAGKSGSAYDRNTIAGLILFGKEHSNDNEPLQQRIADLEGGIESVMRVAPDAFAGTITARLQQAKLVDEAGEKDRAEVLLRETQQKYQSIPGQKVYQLEAIVHERVWFHLSYGEAKTAVQILEQPELEKLIKTPLGRLASDYAWALLIADRIDEGVNQMRLASYTASRELTTLQRLLGMTPPQPQLIRNLDMAHALVLAGRLTEASALSTAGSCFGLTMRAPGVRWQQIQTDQLKRTAILFCSQEQMQPVKPRL
jgi:hypothetical protein